MSARYFQQTTVGGVPLTREISIRTASDAATISDNPGPGRTLDKALAWGGERLERVFTRVLSRTGRGPTSSIRDILRAVYQSSMMPRACARSRCDYWGPAAEITAPPTTYELAVVCEWLVYVANATSRCPECGGLMTEQDIYTPVKSSKKLVKLMSATNKSSCYISVQLLTLLVTIFPSSREVLAGLGAGDVLRELSERMSDRLDMDPLLASSRRALMSLADAEILSLGKELNVMEKIWDSPVIYKLIDCFSHLDKMLLALTVAHRNIWFLQVVFHPVLNTIYPMLLSRLASPSDPVEVAVLTDCLYRIIDGTIPIVSWLIPIIKTRPDLLEHLPDRLRCLILDGLPARYEEQAIDEEQYYGRHVNHWLRAIWHHNPDDPEGEPDDDWKFFKHSARGDNGGFAKIDGVWWEVPVWVTCDRRKRKLEKWEEQGTEDRERRGMDSHRGRRPRAQSMTINVWPGWMKARQKDGAAEWREYWREAAFTNFTGWPRKVGKWLEMEPEPDNTWDTWRDHDWVIYWTKMSMRMRSRSVD